MRKFKFLEDATADVCFKAYGKKQEEVFENAALAMFEVMVDTSEVKNKLFREVEVKGNDPSSLMFKWLNELLFLVDSEGIFFSHFKIKLKDNKIFARCWGEKINPDRHELREEVKACTYHRLEVKHNEVWEARVLLDI